MKAIPTFPFLSLIFTAVFTVGCSTTPDRFTVERAAQRAPQVAGSQNVQGDESGPSSHSDPHASTGASSFNTVAWQEEQVPANPVEPADEFAITDDTTYDVADSLMVPAESALSGDGMTLEALEQLALQNNPSIRQVSAAANKAAGIRNQVGLKPNPTIGYFGEEIGNGGAAGLHGAYVSQAFVRGDKLAWNQQVIGHDVNSVMWQVEAQRQRIRTDVRVSFYEALAAQQRLRLARDFRSIAEKGVTISEDRVSAMVGSRPDVLQSEIQLTEVDLSIQQAEFEYNAAWQELAAFAGLPDLAPAELIGDLDRPATDREIETAYAQIISESPLLASAQARVDRARANLKRQNVQPIPNINAQLGVGHDDGTGDEFANVQLSLPLPVHNRNQGNIRAAHAEYCEATQNVQRIKLQIRQQLAGVMREYQIAQATVRQYETSILPKAQETLDLMQEAQQAGEFDFLRVLTARRAYFDANLKYVAAQGSLAQANAKIDGLLLTGGLSNVATYGVGDDLRGQALSGQ